MSDNTFTLANELVIAIEEREEDDDDEEVEENADVRVRRGLLNTVPLPKTGNLTLHDRR